MKVLLSIKPEFAFKIFEGEKKFEFRKVIFKNLDVKTVLVYASHPVQQVIGEFEIDHILTSNPKDLWERTKAHSGITKEYFYEYFGEREIGHAIKIKKVKKYIHPLSLKDDLKVSPPQSYMYLDNNNI
ncbi:hypothetical protein [Chryseobacterium sp.]|uniref:hypothetical protein n=1 Tax=Chryseobacterium sp. TaxID=1871047 RepID=UPI0035C771D7